jgi:hypothetical protein
LKDDLIQLNIQPLSQSEENMSEFPETVPTPDVPLTPPPAPKKSNKTWIIILVVVIVLCCCCVCLASIIGWNYGDSILGSTGMYSILPLLVAGG